MYSGIEVRDVMHWFFFEDFLEVWHIGELGNGNSFCFVDFHASKDDVFDLVRKVMSYFGFGNRKGETLLQLLLSPTGGERSLSV